MRHVPLFLLLVAGCGGGSASESSVAQVSDAGSGGAAGAGGMAGQSGTGGTLGTGGHAGMAGAESDGGGAAGSAVVDAGSDGGVSSDGGLPSGNPFVYVSGFNPEIRIFQLDMATGMLSPQGKAEGGTNPAYLAWDPSRRYLYATQEFLVGPGRIVAYSIDAASGALTRINDVSSVGARPAYVSVHASGKWVFTSNWTSGHIAVLPIMPSGGLGDAVFSAQPVNENAHMITSDPSGKFVFVACTGPKVVLQYSIDVDTGQLAANDPPSVADPGSPRHIAFHPNAKYAYAINEAGSSVTSFNYDSAAGKLSTIETIAAAPSHGSGGQIIVHPSGKFVYASVRGSNTIGIFAVSPADGRLTRIASENGGGMLKTPRDFNQDATGTFLVVANQDDASVIVFRIHQDDGKLTVIGRTPTAPMPSFVGIMPLP